MGAKVKRIIAAVLISVGVCLPFQVFAQLLRSEFTLTASPGAFIEEWRDFATDFNDPPHPVMDTVWALDDRSGITVTSYSTGSTVGINLWEQCSQGVAVLDENSSTSAQLTVAGNGVGGGSSNTYHNNVFDGSLSHCITQVKMKSLNWFIMDTSTIWAVRHAGN